MDIVFQHTIQIDRLVGKTQLQRLRMGRFADCTSYCGGQEKFKQNNLNKIPKKMKTLEDYYFYVESSKQAPDYEMTYEFLIDHIKKTYVMHKEIISWNP